MSLSHSSRRHSMTAVSNGNPQENKSIHRSFRKLFSSWLGTQIDEPDEIGNSLHARSREELHDDLRQLATTLSSLSQNDMNDLTKALEAGKEAHEFYHAALIARSNGDRGPLDLSSEEVKGLIEERENMFSQRGVLAVIIMIATAAFLQGHVQSSFNGASLYAPVLNATSQHQLGLMNATPFLAAAMVGAPLSLPTNYYIGRRGSLLVSAILIIASSVGSAACKTWTQVLGVRIIAGVGMGIKAVSAPILASETAVGFWRGSAVLTWQLWVSCGIMMGFVVNLLIAKGTHALDGRGGGGVPTDSQARALQYILGSPFIPGVFLMIAVFFCYESPRFYLRPDTPNYDVDKALRILMELRATKLQALRDLILIRWSNRLATSKIESLADDTNAVNAHSDTTKTKETHVQKGLTYASQLQAVFSLSTSQYRTLFKSRRLNNAVLSTCTVALAQQLCGINVFAFYSGTIFVGFTGKELEIPNNKSITLAMMYSFLFGLVNFSFCLPAMRSIDTRGRRQWLLHTLPVMALSLMTAAAVSPSGSDWQGTSARKIVGIIFIYIFAAAYSPGLGPVPFTLASESFPLSHREAGASIAIATNLFFAGLLSFLLPIVNTSLTTRGTLGLFSGLNVVAFVLIFFLVEETRRLNLEDLDKIFDRDKKEFIKERWNQAKTSVRKNSIFRSYPTQGSTVSQFSNGNRRAEHVFEDVELNPLGRVKMRGKV